MNDVREIFRSILDSELSEVVEVTPYGIIYRGKQKLDEAKVFREFQEKISEGIEELEDIVKDTGVGVISNYDDGIDTTIKDLGGDTRGLLSFGWYADISSISLIDLGGPRTYVYLFKCDGHPCFIAALSGPVTSNLLSRFITHLFRENGDDFHVSLGACLPPEGITNDCPDLIDQDNLKQAIWNLFRRHIWMTYDEHDDLPPVEQLAYFETYFKEAYRTNILRSALADKGDKDGYITELRAELRYKPEDAETHRKLGLALAHTGDQDGAITEYRASLRLQPDHTSTHYNLGNALKAKGLKREAAREFHEYLRLTPDTPANRQQVEGARAALRELE